MEQPAEAAFDIFGQWVAVVVALYEFWHVNEVHSIVADLVVDLEVAGGDCRMEELPVFGRGRFFHLAKADLKGQTAFST